MFDDRISDYTEGVAAKYLSAVDAEFQRSHQHGVVAQIRELSRSLVICSLRLTTGSTRWANPNTSSASGSSTIKSWYNAAL